MKILSKIKSIRKSVEGALSVEFALIAPALIAVSLAATNLGYRVYLQQKLAASISSGTEYLQDWVGENDLDAIRPGKNDDTDQWTDSSPVENTKIVIRDAYGNQLSTDDISVETLCGCPDTTQADPDAGTIVPEFTGYYVETRQKDFDDANNLCPSKCNGEQARVTIEIEVILETKDLFNNSVKVSEKLRTRLR